jgi:hypothetical protein
VAGRPAPIGQPGAGPPACDWPGGCRAALALLREARELAEDAGVRPWEFAVGVEELRATGCTSAGLRWLAARGYAEHARESGPPGPRGRRFRQSGALDLDGRTYFVLTEAGLAVARALNPRDGHAGRPPVSADGRAERPVWDGGCRRLVWRGLVVKRLRGRAPSQEAILAAFQEEGWPPRIDDPLPRTPGREPGERLHDSVRRLNGAQERPLLVFGRDGTGEGVTWEARGAD